MNSVKLFKFIIVIGSFVGLNISGANLPVPEKFLNALAAVESSGNAKAYNKAEGAIGIYQVRRLYLIDAQEFNPELRKYTHQDCYNVKVSRMVVEAYFNRYGKDLIKNNDFEGLAKLHNGGLNWRNKTGKAKQRLKIYWDKIQKQLR